MKFRNYLNEFYQKPEKTIRFTTSKNILDDYMEFTLIGQNVERSYEDRDVYVTIKKERDGNSDVVSGGEGEFQTWLKGEDAIEVGKKFIEAGNDALWFNRQNAYEIIQLLGAKEDINRGKYTRLIITKKRNETPPNYGPGFYYYDLHYVGNTPLDSRMIEDVVIYWSPFEEEFNKQHEMYSGGLMVDTIGWSYKEIKKEFDQAYKEQFGQENTQGE